jgi:hypothetical protein
VLLPDQDPMGATLADTVACQLVSTANGTGIGAQA